MSLTAFGELQTAELTPLAGWTFAYNVNTDIVATTTAGSGAISAANGFAVLSTQANVVTLKNQATWQSKANRIRSQIRNLSIATDGTKSAIIRLIKNTTLGGSPSYADHSADTSPIQIDTAGTTITGGSVVFAVTMDKIDSQIWDLDRWGVFVAPGETLTLSVQSAASTDVTATVGWVDLI